MALKSYLKLTCHVDALDVTLATVEDVDLEWLIEVGSHDEVVHVAFN